MKRIDIELLLTWAYLDELPKGGDNSVSQWDLLLLMRGGQEQRDKLPPIFGECHRDAIAIHRAVIELPRPAPALILQHATLQTRPNWHPEQIQIKPTYVGPRVRIVGESRGKNKYSLGSYCPLRWVPSLDEIKSGRLAYLCWWRGLLLLVASLQLRDHQATGPSAPREPWITPPTTTRVLTSMKGS